MSVLETSLRLIPMAVIASALTLGPGLANRSAAGPFDQPFALSSPFPIHQNVKVTMVGKIYINLPGDQDPTGDARFRFRLDTRPCVYFVDGSGRQFVDNPEVFLAPSPGPGHDCNYHWDIRKAFGGLEKGSPEVSANVVLP